MSLLGQQSIGLLLLALIFTVCTAVTQMIAAFTPAPPPSPRKRSFWDLGGVVLTLVVTCNIPMVVVIHEYGVVGVQWFTGMVACTVFTG